MTYLNLYPVANWNICVCVCICMYEVCLEGIQTCNIKNRGIYWRRYKIQQTLYTEQWRFIPLQSRHLGTSHSSPNRHHLPHCIFLNLIDGLKPLSFQMWFQFWEKPEITGVTSGWFDVLPKKLCMRCDVWADTVWWWSCQWPVALSCGLLNHPNSFHRGMFKLNAEFDADSLLCLLSHFECNNHTVQVLT